MEIKQLAKRIADEINAKQRAERDFTKGDFLIGSPLPIQIYKKFTHEFPFYSQSEIDEFTKELTKMIKE